MYVSGKLTLATGEPAAFEGCRIEAVFGQRASGAPGTAEAFSDAAGNFTLERLDGQEIASETVKFVVVSPKGRFIGETEVPTADLGDAITIEVEGLDPAPPGPAPESELPARTAVNVAFRDDAAFRRALTENLEPLRAKSEAVASRVETAFAKFKPTPLSAEELAARHYVEPGKDPGETLEKVIAARVDALGSDETKHTLTLRKTAELTSLMAEAGGDAGAAENQVELAPLINFINGKSAGGSLVSEPVYTECRARLDAESLIADVETPPAAGNGKGAADGQEAPPEGGEADQLVKDSVNLQMHSATPPEAPLEYGSMPSIPNTADKDKVQGAILQTFELRPGASDVTAYHDFYTLEIAFQHVWTRIFDGQLESLGRDLYGEYVKLKDFSGSADRDLSIDTVDDLRRLMDEVKKLSQIVQEDIPGDLRGNGGAPAANASQGSDDLNTAVKAGVGIATGGVSWALEWALEEFSKIGKKPIIKWEQFPGPWPPRVDRIEQSVTAGAAPANLVEIALRTDPGSHLKIVELELYDESSKWFVHGPRIDNGGNVGFVTVLVPTSSLATGVIEFASEESPGLNLGRYVLGDLSQNIPDGSRVTFYWKDS